MELKKKMKLCCIAIVLAMNLYHRIIHYLVSLCLMDLTTTVKFILK